MPTLPALQLPTLSTSSSSLATGLSYDDRNRLLRFAASFLWADAELRESERSFYAELASELGFEGAELDEATELLESPPNLDAIDPTRVSRTLAKTVRHVALRAIAADGKVEPREMEMFHLLDTLLPDGPRLED